MRFVHLANVNLGLSPDSDFAWGEERKKEFYTDLDRVIQFCAREKMDALFITGNLFSHKPTYAELAEVDELFLQIGTTKIVWTIGKNETAEGEYFRNYPWKSDITIFVGESAERMYISKWNAEITSVGYSEKTWKRIQTGKISCGKKRGTQILLLPDFTGDRTAEEIDVSDLYFDYIGLGKNDYYKGSSSRPVYSPGMFEPVDFSGQNRHGYFVVDTKASGREKIKVQFMPGSSREYLSLKINITPELSMGEICAQIKAVITQYGEQNIYRIALKGEGDPLVSAKKNEIYQLGNISEVKDMTEISLEESEADEAVFVKSVERIEEILKCQENDELREKALRYGAEALL